MIMKKLKLTTNRSLDGVTPDINRRQFSEFGNMALIDVSDSEEEVDGKKRIKIAGTRHSDLGERSARPVMRVLDLHFSPTGRSFAVCSTEGVAVFSLDHRKMFDPFQLAIDVTPKNVRHALAEGDFSTALCMSLRLNQSNIIEEVVLGTPVAQVEIVARSLSSVYAEKFLKWLSEGSSQLSTRHVHFWQLWLKYLLLEHARYFKDNKAKNLTALNSIQQLISNNITPVAKLCDQNKYTIQYLLAARKIKRSA
ncbi:hypothetical protein AB6A40_009982 [Gnathostoma spinigerum]|uniref:Small-subunit processome Utp12 domain-containing protein n=1 Tax=Gnathostoma spinigerum TaxID=75299 RepID=A0ABD6ETJ3_9BILA